MLIVCEISNIDLAKRISKNSKLSYETISFHRFPNGEYEIENSPNFENETIFLLFPKSRDLNDSIIKFCMMCSVCKANVLKAIIPYIPYSRQDKSSGIRFIGKLLKFFGISKIITIDIHSKNCVDIIGPTANIMPDLIFSKYITDNKNTILVSPDFGAIDRTKAFAEKLKKDFVVFDKTKQFLNDKSKIFGKDCLIIDDIIDSGRTINLTADVLKQYGANRITACVSHGIFSKSSLSQNIDKIYITESFYNGIINPKIVIVPIDKILSVHLL